MKYEQIIEHLKSIQSRVVSIFNINLKRSFLNFKNNIEEHKTSLQKNIKEYIKKISTNLTKQCCFVQELIDNICKNINNLGANHSKLSEFTQYDKKEKLIKHQTQFEQTHTTHFEKIFEAHTKYKQFLCCYSQIKCRLSKFMCELKNYNYYIIYIQKSIDNYNMIIKYTSVLDKRIYNLYYLKWIYLDKFNNYVSCVKKLQEIGQHIRTMKTKLDEVKDQVDEEAVKYIEGLSDITIDDSKVASSIDSIKEMNNLVIGRLQIAWHTIEFFNTLKGEISKLNDVEFHEYYYDHNNIDYLKHELSTVQYKLTLFESSIKPKLCNVMEQIKEIKKQNEEVTKDGVTCDLIKQVEKDYTSDIQKIKKSIEDSLKEIEMIKHMLMVLENNKNQSPKISDIKCKVCGINQLKDAPSKLNDSREKLDKFLQLQQDTKSLIDIFSTHPKFRSLAKYSKQIEESIPILYALIGYIELSIKFLNGVTKVDYLINCIKVYRSRFETIKGIIQNFKGNVKEIIRRLETINCNLCQIKTLCPKKVENNLDRLKDYMMNLKVYVTHIRNNFNVITGVIDQIRKDISKIDGYRVELESLEKYIECYICYINCNKNNKGLKKTVNDYLESIKDRLNEIISLLKYIKDFHTNPKCINEIKCRLKGVESSVSELECAIEGVARNFIRCSLQSLSTHLVNWNSMYHNRIVKDNIKII